MQGDRVEVEQIAGEFAVDAAIPPGGILVRQAHDHGADAVVTKPFSVDRLLDLVAMQVRSREDRMRRAA